MAETPLTHVQKLGQQFMDGLNWLTTPTGEKVMSLIDQEGMDFLHFAVTVHTDQVFEYNRVKKQFKQYQGGMSHEDTQQFQALVANVGPQLRERGSALNNIMNNLLDGITGATAEAEPTLTAEAKEAIYTDFIQSGASINMIDKLIDAAAGGEETRLDEPPVEPAAESANPYLAYLNGRR